MQLELSSPHFKSKSSTESFTVLVLTSLSNPEHKSFAIDRFPEMDPDAVEKFWIEKARRLRDEREELHGELRSKASFVLETHSAYVQSASDFQANDGRPLTSLTNAELLNIIDSSKGKGERAAVAKAVLNENYLLSSKTFREASLEDLLNMRSDEKVDPIRRTVAGRLYNEKILELAIGNDKKEL
ncbi:hypothetical protein TrRE_jg4358 [Triparma retinervis]|uniref:Uncharacterized protein n=1 Tax=Triparma retinervis TaxID=2557542 RepID=A0A9W7KRK8_9STRA|nr:hypothetical protein TrRE_jg4358 [Triparma retinervis]